MTRQSKRGENLTLRGVRLLTKIQVCNLFGENEFRYTHDRKKKRRWIAMGVLMGLVAVMMASYVVGLCVGLSVLGMADVIPEYLCVITSAVIVCFSILKAGSVIFQKKGYDFLISLPVSTADLVVSRFLVMYVSNLLLSLIVMVPGLVTYGICANPPAAAYLFGLFGILLIPMLPLTVSTAFGALVTAVSARMRNKNLVSAVLTLIFAMGILVLLTAVGGAAENLTAEQMQNLAEAASVQLRRLYIPAAWFGGAVTDGSIVGFLLFAGVSLGLFGVTAAVVARYFRGICTALHATSAKNDYKVTAMKRSSVLGALYRREVKRYFASSIYVTNTLIGYILMAAAGVAVAVIGLDKITDVFGPNLGITVDIRAIAVQLLPFVISFMAIISPTTACSISLEGKQWWILQTLPVRAADIWNAKILLNLTLAAPAYVVAAVGCLIAAEPKGAGVVWILLIPALYIVFAAVAGITVNLALPSMEWENETRVVKQGASVGIAMLVGLVMLVIPCAAMFLLPVSYDVLAAVWCVVLVLVTVLLHRLNAKKQLHEIG